MGEKPLPIIFLLLASFAHAGAGSALVLRWEAVPGAKEYMLEIAEDRAFEQVVTRKRVPHAAYRFVPPSSEVSYFFRVAAVDDLGRPGRFSRAKPIQQVLTAPKIVAPTNGAAIDHTGPQPTVTLQWQVVPDAASYRVTVGASRDLTDAEPKSITEPSLAFRPPELGTYFWRVTAMDKSGLAGRLSPVRAFTIQLGPPRLKRPRPGAVVTFEPPATNVTLRWSSGPANRFDIQVADDGRFQKRPRMLNSTRPSTAVEVREPGTLHWRVRGIDAKGKAGPWSSARFSVRAASITLSTPVEDATVTTTLDKAPVAFAWSAVPGARSYVLTIVDANGAEKRVETRDPTATVGLPRATHTWSVAAFDARRHQTEFSAERTVTIERRLAAPVLTAPAPDSSFVLLAPGDPEIELTWQPIEEASGYQVEISTTAEIDAPEREAAATERINLWVARAGDTFWRVRADGGAWSEVRKLSIAPRAHRAEITTRAGGDDDLSVLVTVLDEGGTAVSAVPLEGSATAGAVTPFDDRGDGTYVATWSGAERATVSVTGPFDLRASAEVTNGTSTVFVGAKLGLLTNFTADASPRVLAHGSYLLPWLNRRLFVTAALGYAYSGKSFDDVVEVGADLHRFPLTIAGGYRHPLPWVEVYGTIGVALDPFVGTVTVDGAPFDSESGLISGVDIAAGANYRLGMGLLSAELALRATSSWDGLFALGGAGAVLTVGYSFAVY